jgi:hypothetical protein
MTPDEINIAIAESVGWRPTTDIGWCLGPDDEPIITPPNYHGDLNAIQEAVMTLSIRLPAIPHADSDRSRFVYALQDLCGDKGAVIATAPQRCEAYLRTMNPWRYQ